MQTMAVDSITWSWTHVNSTRGVSSTLVGDGGSNMPVIVYVLLGVGAILPVVLLVTIAIVLRSRRAARLAVRRRATYNSAPEVNVVVGAWNSPAAGGTANGKPTSADGVGSRSNLLSGDSGQGAGTLSELAVREFFDVHDHQASQLYVSVEPEGRRSDATGTSSPVTAASSTPGSSAWTSGSETSGEMERRTSDAVALIGPASDRTQNFPAATAVSDTEKTRNQTSGDAAFQTAPSTSMSASAVVERAPDSGLPNAENGSFRATGSGPIVHTVVVDVEPPPFNGPAVENGFDEDVDVDDEQRPLPSLSRMRRSEACYDIAQMSSTPVNVPDSPCRATLKSSSALPSPAPPTLEDRCSDTETEPTEELSSEEEKALKCLDAIAFDYADHEQAHESTDMRVSKL